MPHGVCGLTGLLTLQTGAPNGGQQLRSAALPLPTGAQKLGLQPSFQDSICPPGSSTSSPGSLAALSQCLNTEMHPTPSCLHGTWKL